MKTMSARDAKNHFGEFLDTAQREPVIITKNDRPVGVMLSMQDAAASIFPELLQDREPGHDQWTAQKVTETMRRVDSGETTVMSHKDAMQVLRARLEKRFSKVTS